MYTIEQLAEELHKFYRAAFKALHGTTRPIGQFQCDAPGHDHGWSHCNKKKYFLRRAEILLRDLTGEEQARAVFFTRPIGVTVGDFGGTHIDQYPAPLRAPTLTCKEGLGHVEHD